MDSGIYKDHYDFEWNHRAYLTSALNIPIGAATLVLAGIVFLSKNYGSVGGWLDVAFYAANFVCFSGLIFALFCLIRSAHGYSYSRVPTPLKIEKHYGELVAWHLRNGGSEADADRDLEIYFNKRLGEAVERNAKNNVTKSAWIYRAHSGLIVALMALGLASIPYIMLPDEKEAISARIIDPIEVEIVNIYPDDNGENETEDQVPDDPKPAGPSNEEVKEHVVPKETREQK